MPLGQRIDCGEAKYAGVSLHCEADIVQSLQVRHNGKMRVHRIHANVALLSRVARDLMRLGMLEGVHGCSGRDDLVCVMMERQPSM